MVALPPAIRGRNVFVEAQYASHGYEFSGSQTDHKRELIRRPRKSLGGCIWRRLQAQRRRRERRRPRAAPPNTLGTPSNRPFAFHARFSTRTRVRPALRRRRRPSWV